MKKKSKFQEVLEKAKAKASEVIQTAEEVTEESVLASEELTSLLSPQEEPALEEEPVDIPEPVTIETPEEPEPVVEVKLEEKNKKAYNIWYDSSSRCYYRDVVTYKGTEIESIVTSKIGVSQALAMADAQKIFSEKIILKKEGV